MTTIRQALQLIGREQRSRWLLLVVLALGSSAFEMVGAVLVYVLVALVADPTGNLDIPLIGDVRSIAPDIENDALLLAVIAFIGGFFLLRGVVQIFNQYAQQRVAHNAGAKLSSQLVEGYLRWPYSTHLQRTSSELIRNGHHAVQQAVTRVYLPMIRIAAEVVLTGGLLIVLIGIAPAATAIAIVVVGGAAVLVLFVVQPRLKRIGRSAHRIQRDTLSVLQQALHGVRDIKILGREDFFARRHARTRQALARVNYRRALWAALPSTVIELALLGFILAFFTGVLLLGGDAQEILPVLGLFAYAGLRLQPSLQKIVQGLNDLRFAAAPLEDLKKDLDATRSYLHHIPPQEPLPFQRSLTLSDVSFRYEGAARDALTAINLEIRPGEVIGICGPTGGGKTTLVDLMTGLLQPSTGRVAVDEHDLAVDWGRWHLNLGVVPQMGFLVDDTVRRNIALGIPDDEIDEETVREAIALAQLKEFVEALPDGLDTMVGERGVRISGGQRQRLTIARALYRRPAILIFDEGTSALDNATEADLLGAVTHLRGNHTIIFVAHRLSTVKNSDRLIFVKDGRIVGIGTFDDLAKTNLQFQALARS